ncbi:MULTISPECIES: enoyl-CoA hydratase/isomerase family protein [unclassified Janthinobacterium]|uniref:enoyl-CoA hydratase/isomerase family protein n=1 Tax=unclassified Janthinobacterium TaxID=2610881 RepID=UPI000C166AC3|nr:MULTISPECIES: enoyl-CoA hydratase/isomerase family protein [unclassified Janthinobacterium]MDO8067668.1 enoyl-CoA hydratase/isomerase family protein [Janthinobacterium sp. SUN206]PIF10755.1 methylglutaconyl-CoA hydratase [Janthinobacterium sp. 13]
MEFETLKLVIEGNVATVTLNRPDVRNAFNETTIAELARAFEGLGRSDMVRAIVLAANGAAFCAGADLNWMKKMAGYTHAENQADALQLAQMLRTIYLCPKPVVAKVQGDCYAGGMGLVAACDIILVAEDVHFCLSEVRLGLIPATISPYVIKAMGENAARRYFLTAERFSAQEALRIGFAHEVVEADALDAKTAEVLKALTGNSPHAVAQAKTLVREIVGQPVDDALLADTAERIAQIRASEQGREGVQSFLDKRKPSWLMG